MKVKIPAAITSISVTFTDGSTLSGAGGDEIEVTEQQSQAMGAFEQVASTDAAAASGSAVG